MEKTNTNFLESAKNLFRYYKLLADKAMKQLEPAQLFFSEGEDCNSIAVIVQHMSGNMLSRWTDFLTTDGEKPWRDRDSEFEEKLKTPEDLFVAWEKGWDCLFAALDSVTDEQLGTMVYIRNEGHSILEAVNRQLAHYSYHAGQIVFYAKLLKRGSWDSLSIPRAGSKVYNDDKFSKEQSIQNFTKEESNRLENK
ncbi:DUF1572 family protein [Flavobacterium silvaticum]|uniref:DUF1572 family protein n=1 Tax=Flavobacterium silvaticum TaxID=1852020 RepID=A0A972FXV0_9FLAO|nr:DUF1572 family protein [Flavobacterium silvaticum]NMH26841.1 DUF1572 family protein [Flavobacterium silvaticum]